MAHAWLEDGRAVSITNIEDPRISLFPGAPVELTPLKDDPALGPNTQLNDNFQYDPKSQEKCPFAAHTRKTNPRADIPADTGIDPHRIIRRAIQFGPEVTADEAATHRTHKDRGLLFVAYQSNLSNGFHFLQQSEYSCCSATQYLLANLARP